MCYLELRIISGFEQISSRMTLIIRNYRFAQKPCV